MGHSHVTLTAIEVPLATPTKELAYVIFIFEVFFYEHLGRITITVSKTGRTNI